MVNAIVTTESVVDDPLLAKGYQQFQILGLLGDTLIQKSGPFNFSAGLAESWEIKDHKTKYVFKIADKRVFSDGSAITAESVVDSFRRSLGARPLTATGVYLDLVVKRVSVVSNSSVMFELKGAYPNFLEILSMPGLGIFKAKDGKVYGSGPFVIHSQKEKTWCLKRRDEYVGKVGKVSAFCFTVERDIEKTIEGLTNGNVDIAIGSPLEVAMSEQVSKKNVASAAFSLVTTQVFLNFNNPILKEKRNRQLIAKALYQSRSSTGFFTKFDKALNSFLPFGVLSPEYYRAGEARSKLISAVEDRKFSGEKIRVVFPYGIFTQKAVDRVVADLKGLGLEVHAINVKGKEYVDPIVKNDFDLLFMPYLGIISDPDGFVDMLNPQFLGANLTTPTAKILSEIEKIRFSENEDGRMEGYSKALQAFEDEVLMIPFAQNSIPIVASSKIKIPNLNFNFLNLRELDIE